MVSGMLAQDLISIPHRGIAVGIGSFEDGCFSLECTYPDEWQKLYFQLNGLSRDPVVRVGLQSAGLFRWFNEAPNNLFLEAAFDFGMQQGFGFSDDIGGSRLLAGLPTIQGLTSAEMKMFPKLLREHHVQTLCQRASGLSPEQKTLVHLSALGYRAKNIAYELSISEDAVKQRKRRIENHIGVNSFNTVIAVCTRAGFIS